ncbi:hypothetical protein Tco_1249915, partial [Tanacetum coccineum]
MTEGAQAVPDPYRHLNRHPAPQPPDYVNKNSIGLRKKYDRIATEYLRLTRVVESSITEQTRVSTWLRSCLYGDAAYGSLWPDLAIRKIDDM